MCHIKLFKINFGSTTKLLIWGCREEGTTSSEVNLSYFAQAIDHAMEVDLEQLEQVKFWHSYRQAWHIPNK